MMGQVICNGVFNGLKTLTIKENKCAFDVHCLTHQLQLALVTVTKNHIQIFFLFNLVVNVVNVVGASFKHCDILHNKEAIEVESLNHDDLCSGQGLNQETTLKCASILGLIVWYLIYSD